MLNSQQTPEPLEKREGISSAKYCLIRLQSFKRRWLKAKEQKPPAGFKNAMKTHREGFNLLLITKVKGKQMELNQIHLYKTKEKAFFQTGADKRRTQSFLLSMLIQNGDVVLAPEVGY